MEKGNSRQARAPGREWRLEGEGPRGFSSLDVFSQRGLRPRRNWNGTGEKLGDTVSGQLRRSETS